MYLLVDKAGEEFPHDPRGVIAMGRPQSKIKRFEGLPDVIDFPRHIQPILDKHCVKCHTREKMTLPTGITGIRPQYSRDILPGAERFFTPLLLNESRPDKSPVLLAPLAKEAGGLGICPGPIFKDKTDPGARSGMCRSPRRSRRPRKEQTQIHTDQIHLCVHLR